MALITQSYVHGASPTPLIGETIGQNLRRATAEGPARLAQITRHQGVRWTYADLLRRSEDLSVGLRKLGLEKGDRVGIWSANVSEWVLAQFGTALAGLAICLGLVAQSTGQTPSTGTGASSKFSTNQWLPPDTQFRKVILDEDAFINGEHRDTIDNPMELAVATA